MKYTFRLITPCNENGEYNKLENLHNSIFLAGPCPRENYDDDWRFEAFKILNNMGYDGTVITPTNPGFNKARELYGEQTIEHQTAWEREAMNKCSALVFWIARSKTKPARTTNIEFGEWYKKKGVYVGWPEDAIHNEYIAVKLNEQKKTPYDSLENMLADVVEKISNPYESQEKVYFTADTHFSQQRTLELSRRPFVDLTEMDLTMISNWNKTVTDNDIVYHAGDFIDPEKIYDLPKLLNNLNFKELHWVLGNYDRPILNYIINLTKDFPRKIVLNFQEHIKYNNKKYVVVHEPNDMKIFKAEDEIVLFGHIHGRAFAKVDGFDLATDYHNFTPISLEQVEWFRNAMQYWDENVSSSHCNTAGYRK